MKRKVIIILTSAAVIIGVYVVYDYFRDMKKQNMPTETTVIEQIQGDVPLTEETEKTNKEVSYFTIEEIESITDARDPFDTAPIVEKEFEKKEKEYNELKNKIEERIRQIEEERKKAEREGDGTEYKPGGKTFDEHVKEEIDKIIKDGKKTDTKTEGNTDKNTSTKDQKIIDMVQEQAKTYGIDANIILAIIGDKTEADGKLQIKNPDGTYNRGLMQISTTTSKWLAGKIGVPYKDGIEFDNATNIKMGTYYLNHLKKQHDNIHFMLTSYYVGPGTAEKIKQKTGSYETEYSKIILNRMK